MKLNDHQGKFNEATYFHNLPELLVYFLSLFHLECKNAKWFRNHVSILGDNFWSYICHLRIKLSFWCLEAYK